MKSIDTLLNAWTSAIYSQRVHDKSDIMLVSKNIVQNFDAR
jgi:hypothetical protein